MPNTSTPQKKKGEMISSGDEFFQLVVAMRNAQKRYFKERIPKNLEEAKRLERRLDNYLVTIREQEVSGKGILWTERK
mgnify:CR=1 FL=1